MDGNRVAGFDADIAAGGCAVSEVISLGVAADHSLRLYARLAAVSSRILEAAQQDDWEAVAQLQCELVDVSAQMARVEESADTLDELQKTSRVLYLTAALEDQRLATECLARQSALAKREAASLRASVRLKGLIEGSAPPLPE